MNDKWCEAVNDELGRLHKIYWSLSKSDVSGNKEILHKIGVFQKALLKLGEGVNVKEAQ